jgi:hypothetical protein
MISVIKGKKGGDNESSDDEDFGFDIEAERYRERAKSLPHVRLIPPEGESGLESDWSSVSD